jgi:two-component system, LytTR family, response regulator
MKVLIIDDEPLARGLIKEYLFAFPQFELVAECQDGFEGLKSIQQYQPDLIFLDIQMTKINGFEMLELLDKMPAVIFTTAFDEFAMKAFDAHAIDYLLKPFSKERFQNALEKASSFIGFSHQEATQQLLQTNTPIPGTAMANRIVVKENNKIKIIPIANIQFLESADDYVKIHTLEGIYLKNKTMAYFESTIDSSQFIRIHRSYMVNVQLITRIDPYEKESHLAILSTGNKLPVSKTGYSKLKAVLGF